MRTYFETFRLSLLEVYQQGDYEMTEYELVDALASLSSNIVQGQAFTISMLSAYMVVAYTVGGPI